MSEAGDEQPVNTPMANEETNGEVELAEDASAVKGLMILPPRQQTKPTTAVPVLALPPVRADELVHAVKAALAEVVGLAHITNYRFELERDAPSDTIPWKAELISPYTGKDAVISLPAGIKAYEKDKTNSINQTLALDEYGDVSSAGVLRDGIAFGIVLLRYDAATVFEHVLRLRSLLQGSAPCIVELVSSDELPKNEPVVETEKDEPLSDGKEQPKKPLPALPDFLEWKSDNLKDYYYLVCGEDRKLYHDKSDTAATSKALKKKKKGKNVSATTDDSPVISEEQDLREKIPRWNQLDEQCLVKCQIRHSGFHPPPASRKWIGDLAYYEFAMPDTPVLHITATVNGFYINQSTTENGKYYFDPSPNSNPCYSHALLDCLLQASTIFSRAWEKALIASKERAELNRDLNLARPHLSLFRVAVRGDFGGLSTSAAAASAIQSFDATVQSPSWLVPVPRINSSEETAFWSLNHLHPYQVARMEEDLMKSFGIDLRSGGSRDWNEEFQLAREMPTSTQIERIERARLLYKLMAEFGEASVLGVKAIADGQIAPMNPNESMRTQVYLHNNIFFSRAVDAGPDTFKLHTGDKAARKQANRDIQCNQALYRLESTGISTLATVLIDYFGMRYVCQSVLPGILVGDKSHTLILGAVESTFPLRRSDDLQSVLEEKIAGPMMLSSRPVFREPLTESRLSEIEAAKRDMPPLVPGIFLPTPEKEVLEPNETMPTCLPLEAKGIMGSDQRHYVLDIGRFTPRDANWLPKSVGGTGKFENTRTGNGKVSRLIPASLEDDEWALCVLRPELVHRYSQMLISKYLRERHAKEIDAKSLQLAGNLLESDAAEAVTDGASNGSADGKDLTENGKHEFVLTEDDVAYIQSIRFNVNVFLPAVKSFKGTDQHAAELIAADEERARDAANFLWGEVLPKIIQTVIEGSVQLPADGKTLTEFLHRNGVNCRYLGQLAVMSLEQETQDSKVTAAIQDRKVMSGMPRKTLSKYWLELLECEMVARAAKHVLDGYLQECGNVAIAQPAQTIASFLSALVSEAEESAAQTEARLSKRQSEEPDDDDFASLTISGLGGGGDAMLIPVRTRSEVWADIEVEVARRFRYTLTLYNSGNRSRRARYTALLRRVCQRTGVRLITRNYDLGAKCLCSGGDTHGGQLARSYPISPVDVVDIIPLVKHTAAFNEGFSPCSAWPVTLPPLQISLQDARAALERAHAQTGARELSRGLELAQEACTLFQRVTETPNHPGVVEAVELMATIFHEAGDLPLAIAHGDKALSLTIQTGGFDSVNVVASHLNLFHVHYSARNLDRAVKHLRAAMYLHETMAGANHFECFSSLSKLGGIYSIPEYDGQYLNSALRCYEEALKRDSSDRFNEGVTAKQFAKALAQAGNYEDAVKWETKAYDFLGAFLGNKHTWTKESKAELTSYAKSAAERGSRSLHAIKLVEEEAKAEAIAADLLAAEAASSSKKGKASKKKKGKNK
ncbi:hypothetical protein MPSEU_000720300 [Mayamaea pseudoterrestris]|nr:hypothetical protein MPSEU_000720300 [Mayamaea pseudoterrestris]